MPKTKLLRPRIGKVYQVDQHQIHVLETGDLTGHPVLVLHGCGSLAEEVLLPFETCEFRILAPDRPGYGFSSPLPRPERGPISQSFWLEGLLAAIGADAIVIVAHSIGSAPALHLAARRPELVKGLLLISPCCRPVPPKPLPLLRLSAIAGVGPMIRQHVISRWADFFLDRALRSSCFPNPLPRHLAMLPAAHVVNPGAIETMADELRAFNQDMERLPDLPGDLPIHVLFGSHDRIIQPAWHLEWLSRKHPEVIVGLLEGVGHLPHHVAPGLTRRMLSNLVNTEQQLLDRQGQPLIASV
ncbi:esterase [Rhizobium sp. R72]|uniref:alpha/beta fold hydrolase n=1 Tax=unclassified Rhizobium TaxID=2613769 RepID=UPI000B535BBC|nr:MULTISPECIES: alpha/beta hydrolase [unclassified Rhizobium]OWW05410.1 esterase [Rhizobium sp. R72]OWW06467.1 esterase [Rhizobium sp. R711]